jgi:hypothetical protein
MLCIKSFLQQNIMRKARRRPRANVIILSFLDPLLTKLRINNNSFARAFELHTVLYTVLYPYFIYPVTNIMLSASIFLTVVLGLER